MSSFSYRWESTENCPWPVGVSGISAGTSACLYLVAKDEHCFFFFKMKQPPMIINKSKTRGSRSQNLLFLSGPEQMVPEENWLELLLTGLWAVHVKLGRCSPLSQETLRCDFPWDMTALFCRGIHVYVTLFPPPSTEQVRTTSQIPFILCTGLLVTLGLFSLSMWGERQSQHGTRPVSELVGGQG